MVKKPKLKSIILVVVLAILLCVGTFGKVSTFRQLDRAGSINLPYGWKTVPYTNACEVSDTGKPFRVQTHDPSCNDTANINNLALALDLSIIAAFYLAIAALIIAAIRFITRKIG